MADQSDALAGGDGQRQTVVQRLCVAGVLEGDVLEAIAPAVTTRSGARSAVGDADGFGVEGDHFLHVVDAALQVGDMVAEVAQIAVHDVDRRSAHR